MTGRELGCKLTALLLMGVVIFGFFGCLMTGTETGLRLALRKKQQKDTEADLKILIDGALAYARDHAGKLPSLDSSEAAKTALAPPYVLFPDAFTRVGDNALHQTNAGLSGKRLRDFPRPEKVIVFYEAEEPLVNGKPPRTPLPRAVAFLDGTVRRLDAREWEDLARREQSQRSGAIQ